MVCSRVLSRVPELSITYQPSDMESIFARVASSFSSVSKTSSFSPLARILCIATSAMMSTNTFTSGTGSTDSMTLYANLHMNSGT